MNNMTLCLFIYVEKKPGSNIDFVGDIFLNEKKYLCVSSDFLKMKIFYIIFQYFSQNVRKIRRKMSKKLLTDSKI